MNSDKNNSSEKKTSTPLQASDLLMDSSNSAATKSPPQKRIYLERGILQSRADLAKQMFELMRPLLPPENPNSLQASTRSQTKDEAS